MPDSFPGMATFENYSVVKNWNPGGDLAFNLDFLRRLGPSKLFACIDKIVIEVNYDITVATAAIQGENMARLFSKIRVGDYGGVRRNLSGEGQRVLNYAMQGAQVFNESADVAIASPATGRYVLEIPFTDIRAKDRGKDLGIYSDDLSEVILTCCEPGALDLGSSATTINDSNMTVKLWVYQHEERRRTIKRRDRYEQKKMSGPTESEHTIPGGGFFTGVYAFKGGDALTTMAAWDKHSCSPFHEHLELHAKKVDDYAKNRGLARSGTTPGGVTTNDPFLLAVPKAVVIYEAGGREPKLFDSMPGKTITVRAENNTLADMQLIIGMVIPPNAAAEADMLAAEGKKAGRPKRGQGWGSALAGFFERFMS